LGINSALNFLHPILPRPETINKVSNTFSHIDTFNHPVLDRSDNHPAMRIKRHRSLPSGGFLMSAGMGGRVTSCYSSKSPSPAVKAICKVNQSKSLSMNGSATVSTGVGAQGTTCFAWWTGGESTTVTGGAVSSTGTADIATIMDQATSANPVGTSPSQFVLKNVVFLRLKGQLRMVNQTNSMCEVIIRDFVCKRDVLEDPFTMWYNNENFNIPLTSVVAGTHLMTSPFVSTASPTAPQTLWMQTPFSLNASPLSCDKVRQYYKIKKTSKVRLAPGQLHDHKVLFALNRIINMSLVQNVNTNKAGLTHFTMVTVMGLPCHDSTDGTKINTSPANIDVIWNKSMSYNWNYGPPKEIRNCDNLSTIAIPVVEMDGSCCGPMPVSGAAMPPGMPVNIVGPLTANGTGDAAHLPQVRVGNELNAYPVITHVATDL